MTRISAAYSAACPLNFQAFSEINQLLKNTEATLLFAKLKFHEQNSKLHKYGRKCITRSRGVIASWFGFSERKVDRLLAELEAHNLITKLSGSWYGKRQLFISTNTSYTDIPVNLKCLNTLTKMTGSIRNAIIFSKLIFAQANTKIEHENKFWSCIKKEKLADFAGISIRNLDKILQELTKNGFILKRIFTFMEKSQLHYHIPEFVVETILKATNIEFPGKITSPGRTEVLEGSEKPISQANFKETLNVVTSSSFSSETAATDKVDINSPTKERGLNCQICPQQPANLAIPIRISTKQKKTNNNTRFIHKVVNTDVARADNINFISNKLTLRQTKYLEIVLHKTIKKYNLPVSAPTQLKQEVVFNILNLEQRKGVHGFKHALYRCMKIIRDGNWRTPKGFFNYSEEGRATRLSNQEKEKIWERSKKDEFSYKNKELGLQGNCNREIKTAKALSVVERLIKISTLSKMNSHKYLIELAEKLTTDLNELIKDGADKAKILESLEIGEK